MLAKDKHQWRNIFGKEEIIWVLHGHRNHQVEENLLGILASVSLRKDHNPTSLFSCMKTFKIWFYSIIVYFQEF